MLRMHVERRHRMPKWPLVVPGIVLAAKTADTASASVQQSLTVSKDMRVRIEGLVNIIAIVLPANG